MGRTIQLVTAVREHVLAQLRKGVLEYCVLAELQRAPSYGFALSAKLSRFDVLFASGGALYPLLARLRTAGLVDTFWEESKSGPPRRYYRITQDGIASLADFREAWMPFSTQATEALDEGR